MPMDGWWGLIDNASQVVDLSRLEAEELPISNLSLTRPQPSGNRWVQDYRLSP